MLTPLIHAHGSRDSDDVVGAYVFSATLAVQDITGTAYSGVTASHMSKRLEGSAESDALLFALTSANAPRPIGPLGYPVVHESDLADIAAWVFISLPLLEDTGVIEATVTLDAAIAPLPGEYIPREPWAGALSLIDDLSNRLSRPIRQIWVTHSGDRTQVDTYLTEAGYDDVYREQQATFSLRNVRPTFTCDIVNDMNFARKDVAGLRGVLGASSRDYPRGGLILDTVEWTEQRVRDAGARLLDRGGNQLTALARDDDGHIIGMAEAVHYDSDDDRLMELGLVYVLPLHRGGGVGKRMVHDVLAAAKEQWPDLETGYSSHPADSAPVLALLLRLGLQGISFATAWQKTED